MRLVLDVQDHKAAFIMELLQSFPYLKAQPVAPDYMPNALTDNELDIMQYVKPMRDFTIEDLVREQNYKGFDVKRFQQLVETIGLQDEPIEELLECIK